MKVEIGSRWTYNFNGNEVIVRFATKNQVGFEILEGHFARQFRQWPKSDFLGNYRKVQS